MAEENGPAMRRTGASVEEFLARVPDGQRREDARRLCAMMQEITGERPSMWGTSIIGWALPLPVRQRQRRRLGAGKLLTSPWHRYLSGRRVREPAPAVLARLGPHKTGKGCLYIKRLDDADHDALRELIDRSVRVRKGIDRASG